MENTVENTNPPGMTAVRYPHGCSFWSKSKNIPPVLCGSEEHGLESKAQHSPAPLRIELVPAILDSTQYPGNTYRTQA